MAEVTDASFLCGEYLYWAVTISEINTGSKVFLHFFERLDHCCVKSSITMLTNHSSFFGASLSVYIWTFLQVPVFRWYIFLVGIFWQCVPLWYCGS